MANAKQIESLKNGWAALAAGDMDKLASFYAEDMIFVLPGQDDVLDGRTAFRAALDGIGQALPPGFEITSLRYCPGDNEIVNVFLNTGLEAKFIHNFLLQSLHLNLQHGEQSCHLAIQSLIAM